MADGGSAGRALRAGLALGVKGLSKTYGSTKALHDVDISVSAGEIHALVGGNGSGKSTLIKVLAGVVEADQGDLFLGGEWTSAAANTPARAKAQGLHFVHQQNSTFAAMTVAENIGLGRGFESRWGRISWSAQHRRAQAVLDRFQIHADPRTLLGSLSAANQMMVAIARALQDQDESGSATRGTLILDEPTASLPKAEVELLLSSLKRYAAEGQTIIYVSHRLEEITRVASAASVLRNGMLVAELRGDDVTHDQLVLGITGRALASWSAPETSAPLAGTRRPVLVATYEGDSEAALEVAPGEIVGVAGLLGSGRTRLLRSIFGAMEGSPLQVEVDGARVDAIGPTAAMQAGVGFVPENRLAEAAFIDLSIAENISIAALPAVTVAGYVVPKRERGNAQELITRFDIKAQSDKSPLASLSGGNQQKVILARWLQRQPKVLLLDEPTQGVDVGARSDIHQLVRRAAAEGSAVLVVSSDFKELVDLCHRAVLVSKGRVVGPITDELTEDNLTDTVYALEAPA